MESNSDFGKITFQVLQMRLITFVNTRIGNGDFTERGLAKILGISQSQIHNVLKGVRKLRPELADRLIRKFEISVLDLLDSSEIYEQALARGPLAVGRPESDLQVGQHIPPKRLQPETIPKKKPGRQETRSRAGRASQA